MPPYKVAYNWWRDGELDSQSGRYQVVTTKMGDCVWVDR